MKKHTNKILIVTLLIGVSLVVVFGTIEVRKAYHNGEIKTVEEVFKNRPDKTIANADTTETTDVEAEIEK